MQFDGLCEQLRLLDFPKKDEKAHPDESTVQAARTFVAHAVSDDAFLAHCLNYQLNLIESGIPRRGLTPFYVHPEFGIRFAFGHWGPGVTPGPHEHTAWTITAVCRNKLEVYTFDRDASYKNRSLIAKNHFKADAGNVGFIYRPCIHAPINTSQDWTLTFHVTSPRDGEPLYDFQEYIADLDFSPNFAQHHINDPAYAVIERLRRQQMDIWQIGRILAKMDLNIALKALQHCHAMCSSASKRRLEQLVPSLKYESAQPSLMLFRTSEQLSLGWHMHHNQAVLFSEGFFGRRPELSVNAFGREAISFAARENGFYITDIPGNLTMEEKIAFGESLEDTGLFRSVIA